VKKYSITGVVRKKVNAKTQLHHIHQH